MTYRSALLLDPFLEHHAGNMQEKWDELEQSLKDSCSKSYAFYIKSIPTHFFPGNSKSFQTAQQIVSFFTLLLSKEPNDQVRVSILNYILSICLCDKRLSQDEAAVFVLLKFFFETRNGLEKIRNGLEEIEDYSDYSIAINRMRRESDIGEKTVWHVMKTLMAKEKYRCLRY